MRKISLLLADHHQLFRQGLRALLEAKPDFAVAGETGDGLETLRLVDRLRPDVVLLNLMLPSLNGLEVTRRVTKSCPKTRVIILSIHPDESCIIESLQNGAAGYLSKEASITDLVAAIHEALAGRRYLSPPFSHFAIEMYLEKTARLSADRYQNLTAREKEVLQLVAEGHTNGDIGKRLFTSPRTIEVHRAHLMHKLRLHTQTDLIRYALARGLLPLEENTAAGSETDLRAEL